MAERNSVNILCTDYSKLESSEKKQFFYDFSLNCQEILKDYSNETIMISQLIFINRVFNSYKAALLQSGKEISQLILLWDYAENKCSEDKLDEHILMLREKYKDEVLFSESQIQKLAEFYKQY